MKYFEHEQYQLSFTDFKKMRPEEIVHAFGTMVKKINNKEIVFFNPHLQHKDEKRLYFLKINFTTGVNSYHRVKVRYDREREYVLIEGKTVHLDNFY